MFNTFEEVSENKFINGLNRTCDEFGCHGVYVMRNEDINPEKNGIYFVFGADKDKVFDENKNIDEILDKVKKDRQNCHLDIVAVKLTDCSPFAMHQTVTDRCRDIEFITKLYQERKLTPPDKVDCTTFFYMETLYKNSIDKDISPENLAIYKEAVNDYFSKLDKRSNGKEDVINQKGLKKILKTRSNKVSLEKLLESSFLIAKHRVSAKLLPAFEKEMKKHPEILYHVTKVNKVIFDAPEKGVGPNKEDNDLSTIDIAYNSVYKREISTILAKISVPEAFKTTIQEMRDNCGEDDAICHFGIQNNYYEAFAEKCKVNNVDFIIDNEQFYYSESSALINIAFYQHDIDFVDKILTEIAIHSEEYHKYDKKAEIITDEIGLNSSNKAVRNYFEKR